MVNVSNNSTELPICSKELHIDKACPKSVITVRLWVGHCKTVLCLESQARLPPRADRLCTCHSREKQRGPNPIPLKPLTTEEWQSMVPSPCSPWLWFMLSFPVASWDLCTTTVVTVFLCFTKISQYCSTEEHWKIKPAIKWPAPSKVQKNANCSRVQRQTGRQRLRFKDQEESY